MSHMLPQGLFIHYLLSSLWHSYNRVITINPLHKDSDTEWLSEVPGDTQLVREEAKIQTLVVWFQSPYS